MSLLSKMNYSDPKPPSSWVFSPSMDLIIFLGPIVCALLVRLLIIGTQGEALTYTLFQMHLIYAACLDLPHTLSTLYRLTAAPDEFRKRRNIYFILFFGILLIGIPLCIYWQSTAIKLMYIGGLFHYIRQQYGWMRIAERNETQISSVDKLLDKIIIYNVTLLPIFGLFRAIDQRSSSFSSYFSTPNFFGLPILPTAIISALLGIHWLINILYITRQIFIFNNNKTPNYGKLLIIFSTWLAYFGGVFYFESFISLLIIFLLHTFPYIVLTLYYFRQQTNCNRGQYFLLYSLVFISSALIVTGQTWHQNPEFLKNFFFNFGILITFLHYGFDTIVWKFNNKNNSLLLVFGINHYRYHKNP